MHMDKVNEGALRQKTVIIHKPLGLMFSRRKRKRKKDNEVLFLDSDFEHICSKNILNDILSFPFFPGIDHTHCVILFSLSD